MPAKRFKISDRPCLRLSRILSLRPPRMASAIPAAYEQALKAYSIDDTSMLLVSVGDPRPSLRFGHARSVISHPARRAGLWRAL